MIGLLAAHANGVDQMGLTAAGGTVYEEGVEGGLARMLCDRESYRARQLVGVALDIVLESLLGIELRVQLLGHGGIEHGG